MHLNGTRSALAQHRRHNYFHHPHYLTCTRVSYIPYPCFLFRVLYLLSSVSRPCSDSNVLPRANVFLLPSSCYQRHALAALLLPEVDSSELAEDLPNSWGSCSATIGSGPVDLRACNPGRGRVLDLVVDEHATLVCGSIEYGIVRDIARVCRRERKRAIGVEVVVLTAGNFDILTEHFLVVNERRRFSTEEWYKE